MRRLCRPFADWSLLFRALCGLFLAFQGGLLAQDQSLVIPAPTQFAMPPLEIPAAVIERSAEWLPPLPGHDEIEALAREAERGQSIRELELERAREKPRRGGRFGVLLLVAGLTLLGLLVGAWSALRRRL